MEVRPFPVELIAGREVGPGDALFLGNVGCESVWESGKGLKFPYVVSDQVQTVVLRCDELLLYVAGEDDVVILRHPPDSEFAEYLRSYGLRLPRIECPESSGELLPLCVMAARDPALQSRLAASGRVIVPYASTPAVHELAGRINADMAAGAADVTAICNDKSRARTMARSLGLNVTDGYVCSGIDQLDAAYQILADRFERVVLKELHGVSGRGLMVVDRGQRYENVRRVLARRASAGADRMIIEGWYDIESSLNCQFLIGDRVHPYFCGQQLLSRGMFVGSLLPASAGVGADEQARHVEAAALAAAELKRLGYRGVAGIDTVRTTDGELFPVIEINARFNFSTYFYSALRLIGSPPAAVARWFELHLSGPLGLEQLLSVLGPDRYRPDTGQGYLILTFGSVNASASGPATKPVPGRVFLLVAGEDQADAIARAGLIESRILEFNVRAANAR